MFSFLLEVLPGLDMASARLQIEQHAPGVVALDWGAASTMTALIASRVMPCTDYYAMRNDGVRDR